MPHLHFPNAEIVTDSEHYPMAEAAVAAVSPGVKHPQFPSLVPIRGNVHRPEHQVVPASEVSEENRFVRPPLVDRIHAHRRGNKIVVRQDEVRKILNVVVVNHVDVAFGFPSAAGF